MKNIIATILIIGSVAIFFGYINTQYQQINTKRVEMGQYNEALNNAQQLRQERDDLLKKYNSLNQDQVARLTKLLPDGVDNVKLVLDINDVANRYGVSIKNIKIDQSSGAASTGQFAQDKNAYGAITLSFGVTTTYENFLLFLQDLEKNLRLVDLSALSFTANKDATYTFNLSLQTYWLK